MAEPSHIVGVRGTGNINQARRIVDMDEKIFNLEPRKTPLVTLLTTMGKTATDGSSYKGVGIAKKVTINPKFDWLEDQYGGRWSQINLSGGYNSGATDLVVDNSDIFTIGDIVKIPRTGETVLVTANVTATETLTVTRSVGGTAAASINDNDYFFIIGNANEENAASRNANSTITTDSYNYTQIFRTSINVSQTLAKSDLYGGADLPYLRTKHAVEHCLDIERAFWFGERSEATGTNGQPIRTTGGILEYISTNSTNQSSSTLTEAELNTFLRSGFAYGSGEKFLFADGIVLGAISAMAVGQLRIQPKEDTYGVAISTYVSPFGQINIVQHPEFVNSYAGYAFLIDAETLKYRYLRDRDTKLRMNVQANDVDGEKDEFLTECGLERTQEARNAILYGVTAS